MITCCTHPRQRRWRYAPKPAPTVDAITGRSRVDPTGTTNIVRRWEMELVRRFNRLKALVIEVVDKRDVLGLGGGTKSTVDSAIFARVFAPAPPAVVTDALPPPSRFEFGSSSEKIAAFIDWLYEQQRLGILGVVEGMDRGDAAADGWQNIYIDSAYRKAMRDTLSGIGSDFNAGAFTAPFHADRVGIIYSRAYNELEGINDVMSTQMSRILAQGMADGRSSSWMARELADRIDSIGIVRARTLARTETINAYAESTLNTLEEAGVRGVEVMAEFSTAGDDAVCPDCDELDGNVMSIDEARGLIPVHPNCRCAFLPVVE